MVGIKYAGPFLNQAMVKTFLTSTRSVSFNCMNTNGIAISSTFGTSGELKNECKAFFSISLGIGIIY